MLAAEVNGLGMKEASHFLRNIGHLDLAIIDRHILTHLLACGAIDAIPRSITPARYRGLEESFESLAHRFGLSMQQLDLLFWSFEEGSVRK
jgi:N-glycosylase/DNA lyase